MFNVIWITCSWQIYYIDLIQRNEIIICYKFNINHINVNVKLIIKKSGL